MHLVDDIPVMCTSAAEVQQADAMAGPALGHVSRYRPVQSAVAQMVILHDLHG